MLKTRRILFVSLFTVILCFSLSSGILAESFSDISGHWAESQIEEAVDKGFIHGRGDGTFGPNDNITRAELATIYAQVLKLENKADNTFTDLSQTWYTDYVLSNVYAGILSGFDNKIRPDDSITRQEAAQMMGVCVPKNATGNSIDRFLDKGEIAEWAFSNVSLCANKGYFSGDQNGYFHPLNNLSRAEAASILLRMTNKEKIVPSRDIDNHISVFAVTPSAAPGSEIREEIRSNGLSVYGGTTLNIVDSSILGQSTFGGTTKLTSKNTKLNTIDVQGDLTFEDSTINSMVGGGHILMDGTEVKSLILNSSTALEAMDTKLVSLVANAPTTVTGNNSEILSLQQNTTQYQSEVPAAKQERSLPATTPAVKFTLSYRGESEKVVTVAYGERDTLLVFLNTFVQDTSKEDLIENNILAPFNRNLSAVKELKVSGLQLWSDEGWEQAIDLFDGTGVSASVLNAMKPNFNDDLDIEELRAFFLGLATLYDGGLSNTARNRLVANLKEMDLTTTGSGNGSVSFTLVDRTGTITNNEKIGERLLNEAFWTEDTMTQFFAEFGNTLSLTAASQNGKTISVKMEKITLN